MSKFWQIVSRQIVVNTLKWFGTFFDTNIFDKPHGSLLKILSGPKCTYFLCRSPFGIFANFASLFLLFIGKITEKNIIKLDLLKDTCNWNILEIRICNQIRETIKHFCLILKWILCLGLLLILWKLLGMSPKLFIWYCKYPIINGLN